MADDKTNKVPSWDGTPESYEVYKTKARWFVKGFKPWEQEMAVSKLVVKLTGRAWDAIQQLPEERCHFEDFPAFLLFLQQSCLESAIPESGRIFREYFTKFRRQKGETMKMYVQRHQNQLSKIDQCLKLVSQKEACLKDVLAEKITNQGTEPLPKRRTWRGGRFVDEESETGSNAGAWDQGGRQGKGKGKGKSGKGSHQGKGSIFDERTYHSERDEFHYAQNPKPVKPAKKLKERLHDALAEIGNTVGANNPYFLELLTVLDVGFKENVLPDLLTGWLLLTRSGLNGQERATVLAQASISAVANGRVKATALQLSNIEQAMQQQWEDQELRDRDRNAKPTSALAAIDSGNEDYASDNSEKQVLEAHRADTEADSDGTDYEQVAVGLLERIESDDEERAAVEEALQVLQTSRTNIKKHKRNFVQARALIRDVRKNRKFFPRKASVNAALPKFKNRSSSSSGKKLCFRCGGDHLIKDCKAPKPTTPTKSSAHFVFMNTEDDADRKLRLLKKQLEIKSLKLSCCR